MLLRVLQFVLGAALAGGGAYLAWSYRDGAVNLFPPGAAGLPFLLLAGLFGITSGIVFLVSAVHPRPNQRRALADRAARENVTLEQADAYYSQRSRAADRDWRSGDITPLAPPAPPPEPPKPPQPVAAAPPIAPAELAAAPLKPRSLSMPPPAPKPAAPVAKPVASSEPVANGASAPPPSPFPAQVTLAPLPRAAEPPPAAAMPKSAPAELPASTSGDDPHAAIRAAINAGKLDEADRMLAAARDNATGMELAHLTALAGDHAAVSGRQSHAKWLWRLALKRFGELGSMDSAAAKAVAESLRQSG